MKRLSGVVCWLALLTGVPATARAPEIEEKYFVGKWELSDARVKGVITTVEFDKDHSCKPGVWGREFGGPNPLGANTWRIKGTELELVYIKSGRPREDLMLSGSVKPISADEFEFTVTGGFYGMGKNRGLIFRLKRV